MIASSKSSGITKATVGAGAGAGEPGGASRRRVPRWLVAIGCIVGIVAMFALNLRLSQTVGSNSDSASPALQGWDMLHGNLLQHGWITADVPYFPTEVIEDALVVAVRGAGSDAVHWGGALTYTLLMVLAALLAMGRRGTASWGQATEHHPTQRYPTQRQRLARGAMAAGIMIAPQLSAGTYTLLLGPDHTGTAAPVLLAWLIIDRAGDSPAGRLRRWGPPAAVALILALAGMADLTTPFIASMPLVAVYGYRVLRRRLSAERLPLARQGYELALAAAGLVATVVAALAVRIFRLVGSVAYAPPITKLSPLHLIFWHNVRVAGQCLLILAGADFIGVHQPAQLALAVLHLVGAALGAAGILLAAWRFVRDRDVISQLLVAGIALNLATFIAGTHSGEISFAREIAPVLSLGAALAGRLLAGPLLAGRAGQAGPAGQEQAGQDRAGRSRAARWLAPALAVALAGYLAGLGYEVRQPRVPAQNAAVIPFLRAHHLTYGLSGYWGANVITLDTGGQVTIRSLTTHNGRMYPSDKLDKLAWFDPRHEYANFVVMYPAVRGTPPFSYFTGVTGFTDTRPVLATFGQPAQTYHDGGFTILVWNKNLLSDMTYWPDPALG